VSAIGEERTLWAMAGPTPIHVSTRSGKVIVTAAPHHDLHVIGGVINRYDDGTADIRRERGADKIEVRCPDDTDVTIGTVSGSVECEGMLGAVRISTVSGKVRVTYAKTVDVRTKSGIVEIGECEGDCRVVTTSSKVHVGRAARATIAGVSGVVLLEKVNGAEVKTVSGKVLLGTTGDGPIFVKTVSGRVDIRVPREMRPATRLYSLSGKVQCDCEPGADGEIAVKSVSGKITVSSG
jgi:DUF4097 and DUF4098 domain-containing protein YvlB